MSFNQTKYIADYNKNNYKMYQFRVRLDENEIIQQWCAEICKNTGFENCMLKEKEKIEV